jgi:prephenate dehydrogenase
MMKIQISIIGMGQIGTSIGLALAEKKDLVFRVGHDRDPRAAKQAEKMGALDKVSNNLPAAIREADIVILSLPVDMIKDALQVIARDLKEGCVVMDTAPVKEIVADWTKELLPENRYYVGLLPVLNPVYLDTHGSGVEAAHADLFRGGMMVIVAPPFMGSEAIKLASDLTRLLGADPLFADPVEVDSLMAATHILPQLLAAALLNVTVDQPGWREGRMLAGRAFTEMTGPIVQLGEAAALSAAAILTSENVLRITDSVIAVLQSIRNDLKNMDEEALKEKLERARSGRERWWIDRQTMNAMADEIRPEVETPKSSDMFRSMFGFGRKKDKPKQD